MNDAPRRAPRPSPKEFVRTIVGRMEIGKEYPYQLRPDPGGSGYTFGKMQNNTWANEQARFLLDVVLGEAEGKGLLDRGLANRAKGAIRRKDQTLAKGDLEKINEFLEGKSGEEYRKLIDGQDDHQIEAVAKEVEAVIEAVQRTSGAGPLDPGNLDPETVAILAAWANRVDNLKQTTDRLREMARTGGLTAEKVRDHICGQKHFRTNEDCAAWVGRLRENLRGLGGPAPRGEKRGDASGAGGEVHVNAHTREDYDVRAHTRGRPSR